MHPVTQVVTTTGKEQAREDSYQTFSGTIEGAGDTRTSSPRENKRLVQRIFEATDSNGMQPLARRLTPQRFSELWGRLEAAGLFKLPRYPGPEPPEDKPYFLLESGNGKWIFELPRVRSPKPDDPGVQSLEHWRNAKIEFFNFLNNQ